MCPKRINCNKWSGAYVSNGAHAQIAKHIFVSGFVNMDSARAQVRKKKGSFSWSKPTGATVKWVTCPLTLVQTQFSRWPIYIFPKILTYILLGLVTRCRVENLRFLISSKLLKIDDWLGSFDLEKPNLTSCFDKFHSCIIQFWSTSLTHVKYGCFFVTSPKFTNDIPKQI